MGADRLRIRLPLGWGAVALCGLSFITGLGWLYWGLVREIDHMVRSTLAQFVGTLPFFIGVAILSFRRCCDIDRARSQVVKWWGVLWPWSRREFALAQFDKVSLRQEPRSRGAGRKSKAYDIYPVRLDGAKRLDLRVDLPVAKARVLAAEVSGYLNLPLVSTVPDTGEEP